MRQNGGLRGGHTSCGRLEHGSVNRRIAQNCGVGIKIIRVVVSRSIRQQRDQGLAANSGQLDHHLADISAVEETDESFRRLVDSLHHGFLVLQLARPDIRAHLRLELALAA